MIDIIDNIIQLKLRLTNKQDVEFGIMGNIEDLNLKDINLIVNIWDYIDDIYCVNDNETIYKENLQDFLKTNIALTIKIGNIPGYYDTFQNFLSGNKIKCNFSKFYIEELNYRDEESTTIPKIIENYKCNLEVIALLKEIADYKKEQGNRLELFFYKSENGVTLDINYNEGDLKNLIVNKIFDLKAQLLESTDSVERKQLFVNELISDLTKNGNTYPNLLKNWEQVIGSYEKSFKLYLSGFSFEKIKTSSLEYFQKLTDRIYDSISKVASYIFGIPIGYILLLNNFDFKGEQVSKNISLLILGILFFILMWHVFLNNIDESITAIEKDIKKFRDKISGKQELAEILSDLDDLEKSSIKKQKNKLMLVKYLSVLILIITIFTFLYIYKGKIEKLFTIEEPKKTNNIKNTSKKHQKGINFDAKKKVL